MTKSEFKDWYATNSNMSGCELNADEIWDKLKPKVDMTLKLKLANRLRLISYPEFLLEEEYIENVLDDIFKICGVVE